MNSRKRHGKPSQNGGMNTHHDRTNAVGDDDVRQGASISESRDANAHDHDASMKKSHDKNTDSAMRKREASKRAAQKRRKSSGGEWKRAFRLFWHRNRTMVTVIIAVFIVIEGSVAWFYPAQWWKPMLAMLSVSALVLLWRNLKAMLKCVLSLAMAFVMAALAVQSGYAYDGIDTSALWGLSILTGWAVAVLVSYFIQPMMSRWTMSLIATVFGFSASYMFMPLGKIAIMASAIGGSIIAGGLLLVAEAVRRRTGVIRPARDWNIKAYNRMDKTMRTLWPMMRKPVGVKLLGTWSTTVWYGEDCPTIIMIPLSLTESFRDSKRFGITYRHRSIQSMAVWMVLRMSRMVGSPSPIVVFVDQNGVNEASDGSAEVMGFRLNDSMEYVYAGIIDGSVTSVGALRKSMASLVRKFSGLQYATKKQADGIARNLDGDWERHLSRIGGMHDAGSDVVARVPESKDGPVDSDAGSDDALDRNGNKVESEPLSKSDERKLMKALRGLDLK